MPTAAHCRQPHQPPPLALLLALLLICLGAQLPKAAAQNAEVERICGQNPFERLKQIAENILQRTLTGPEFHILFNRALSDPEKGPRLKAAVTRYQECSLGNIILSIRICAGIQKNSESELWLVSPPPPLRPAAPPSRCVTPPSLSTSALTAAVAAAPPDASQSSSLACSSEERDRSSRREKLGNMAARSSCRHSAVRAELAQARAGTPPSASAQNRLAFLLIRCSTTPGRPLPAARWIGPRPALSSCGRTKASQGVRLAREKSGSLVASRAGVMQTGPAVGVNHRHGGAGIKQQAGGSGARLAGCQQKRRSAFSVGDVNGGAVAKQQAGSFAVIAVRGGVQRGVVAAAGGAVQRAVGVPGAPDWLLLSRGWRGRRCRRMPLQQQLDAAREAMVGGVVQRRVAFGIDAGRSFGVVADGREQAVGGGLVAAGGRHVQRVALSKIARQRIGANFDDAVVVTVGGGTVQGGPLVDVGHLRIGAYLQQQAGGLQVAVLGGQHQRRAVVRIGAVDQRPASAAPQHRLEDADVASSGGVVKAVPAEQAVHHLQCAAAAVQQGLNCAQVALVGGQVQRRAALRIGGRICGTLRGQVLGQEAQHLIVAVIGGQVLRARRRVPSGPEHGGPGGVQQAGDGVPAASAGGEVQRQQRAELGEFSRLARIGAVQQQLIGQLRVAGGGQVQRREALPVRLARQGAAIFDALNAPTNGGRMQASSAECVKPADGQRLGQREPLDAVKIAGQAGKMQRRELAGPDWPVRRGAGLHHHVKEEVVASHRGDAERSVAGGIDRVGHGAGGQQRLARDGQMNGSLSQLVLSLQLHPGQLGAQLVVAIEAGHVQRRVALQGGRVDVGTQVDQLARGEDIAAGGGRVQRSEGLLIASVDLSAVADQQVDEIHAAVVGGPVQGAPVALVECVDHVRRAGQQKLGHFRVAVECGMVQRRVASPIADVRISQMRQ
uniref:Protein kinase domain-containing protein n=1 Tax=Macrostomum lignano TaxID=282301 RepID=A0A1I8FS19_9PLAT